MARAQDGYPIYGLFLAYGNFQLASVVVSHYVQKLCGKKGNVANLITWMDS